MVRLRSCSQTLVPADVCTRSESRKGAFMTSRGLFKKRNLLDHWRHVEVRRDSDLKKGVFTTVSVGFCVNCGIEKFIDPADSNSWICECGAILKYHFCRPWEHAFVRLVFEQGVPEYLGQEDLDELGLKGWEAYSMVPVQNNSLEEGVTVIVGLKRIYPLLHDFY